MATTVAALKGKLGSTEYFIFTMKAQSLLGKVVFPNKLPGWENMSIEEKEQRDIDINRVKKEIAPYLASDGDRFFGAIVVTAKIDPSYGGGDSLQFEHISEVLPQGVPQRYATDAKNIGFLTLTDGESFFPLDGQHRLKAIEFAIAGKDDHGKEIEGITMPCLELAHEDITVILVPESDNKKSRKIFTKVNKYAKKTSAGENLVTDDDDIIAVLSRKVANDQNIFGTDLINHKTNTLSDRSPQFTTLTTIAECNIAILESNFGKIFGKAERKQLPDSNAQKLYEKKVLKVWKFLSGNIVLFADVLKEKGEDGDGKRREIRKDYLLGKPAGQACLVRAFARLTAPPTNLTFEQAADKLNAIDWQKEVQHWDRLFMSGGKIITTETNKKLVTNILCYCAGEKLPLERQKDLLDDYQHLFPENDRSKITELPNLMKKKS